MDAGKYYAILRFEEAALALRTAFELRIVEELGDESLSLQQFADRFGFTHQAARTYSALLEVIEVLDRVRGEIRVSERAKTTLADELQTSRKPYLEMGPSDEVTTLIEMLRGNFKDGMPLYSGDDQGDTLMDQPDVGRGIATALSSRARNFAEPLARVLAPYAKKARIVADIGAGSPYVSLACTAEMPQLKKAILVDRANAMVFAKEMLAEMGKQGADESKIAKIDFCEQDFFQSVPAADAYCVSNTAHDWLPEEYSQIMTNIRDSIAPGGVVCVHEPLLLRTWNTAEQWVHALWMACYALTLFKLTQGKGTCYSREEHNDIMGRCGFSPVGDPEETQDGCTALFYRLAHEARVEPQNETARESAPSPMTR